MKRPLYLLVLLAATTCVSPTALCGCSPKLGLMTVYGVVSRGSTPVVGMTVATFASSRGCSGTNEIVTGTPRAVTNAMGQYRQFFGTSAMSDSGCVTVTAIDIQPTRVDSVTVTRYPLRLRNGTGVEYYVDSMRVDITLPQR